MDLFKLKLDVKHKFNADNKRLYDEKIIIAEKKKMTAHNIVYDQSYAVFKHIMVIDN